MTCGNQELLALEKTYLDVLHKYQKWHNIHDIETLSLKAIGSQTFEKDAIELFSEVSLVKFQEHWNFSQSAGIFLSALVNSCKEDNFTIRLCNILATIDSFGFKNRKNVVVFGDQRDNFGQYMENGSLTLYGNAQHALGSNLGGGSIIIHGNVGTICAFQVKNGEIIVNGNSGGLTGAKMQGGSLTVNGRISSLDSDLKGGNIFQYSRQLVQDGTVIAQPENK